MSTPKNLKAPDKKPDPKKPTSGVVRTRQRKTKIRRHSVALLFLTIGATFAALSLVAFLKASEAISLTKRLEVNGVLRAIEVAEPVVHDTGGTLQSVFVTEGETVREGQIIAALDTSDLREELLAARIDVVQLLVRAQCLRAMAEDRVSLKIDENLREVAGKLRQVKEMQNQQHECTKELQSLEFDRALSRQKEMSLQELSNIAERRAQTGVIMFEGLKQIEPTILRQTQYEKYAQLDRVLSLNSKAKEAKLAFETLKTQNAKSTLRFQEDIKSELRTISDRLVLARAELTRMERLLEKKFVYASVSGRVQRMRVSKAGTRIAANARIMEIAPLETDFEIVAKSSVVSAPDIELGQQVQVKLSGIFAQDIWIPARIEDIRPISKNMRQITIFMAESDLKKRDLLRGDRTLNGLGENADALISVASNPSDKVLLKIVGDIFRNQTGTLLANLKALLPV